MMRWQDGPINSPMGSPRMMGSMSPRANTAMGLSPRSSQVQGLYYQQAMQQQMPGSHQFWDSFVAKQNAKALDTLSRSGHMSPRAVTPGFLSPRSRNTTVPRLVPGKTLSESLGIALPPLSPRDSASPRARRAFMAHTLEEAIRPGAYKGSIDVATERRLKEAAKRKAQLSSLERRIVTDTENALNSRFADMWSAFKNVDVDASGKINKDEIMKALRMWNVTGQNASVAEEAEAILKMCDVDGDGSITYEEFVNGLANHRDMQVDKWEVAPGHKMKNLDPLRDPLAKLRPGVTANELVECHQQVRERLLTKHENVHKAFKYMDVDGSGFIDRGEFEHGLKNLNISVRQPVLDTLLDIIDAEDNDDGGDGHDIGFKEFSRVMQAADVFKMAALGPRPSEVNPVLMEKEKQRKEALKHLRPGVSQEELRKFQEQVKSKISAKYGKHAFTSAFKWIDADRTGSITRDEFKKALSDLNLAGGKEAVLDTLCDFIDSSGDGTFGYREFSRVLAAEDVMLMAPDHPVIMKS